MDYFFYYDLTFSATQYINIYTYQHEYLYIDNKYDILIEIYKYIAFIFFDYNDLTYIFYNLNLTYLLFYPMTVITFCGLMLDLNHPIIYNGFIISIVHL